MSYSTYNRRRGLRPCPAAARAQRQQRAPGASSHLLWEARDREPEVCECIPVPVLQLQEGRLGQRGAAHHEERGFTPHRPCCLCWTRFSSRSVSAGFGGSRGVRGAQLPWAEGLVQGCPSAPQHRQRLPPGQGSGLSTELVACVESVNCTAISLVYMNQ